MKHLVRILFGLVMVLDAQSAMLVCESRDKSVFESCDGDKNRHLFIGGQVSGQCRAVTAKGEDPSELGDDFDFEISGYGPGIEVAQSAITLICPTALEKNLEKRAFVGIKASASGILGVDAGVFVNKRGGMCILLGVKNGFGATLAGAKLKFVRKQYINQ